MERNAQDNFGTPGQGANQGTAGVGTAGGSVTPGAGAYVSGGEVADRVEDAGNEAAGRLQRGKEAVQDRLGTLKEKASDAKASLADKLDAGADRLRQRAGGTALAGGTAGGSGVSGMAGDDRLANVGNSVATGMSSTANWLRDADLQGDIERQVREHPGRTLLIAVGLGYLIGKAFRR